MSSRTGAGAATLRVSEIFTSIQGESTFAGWPCVFIRLAGCPLNCAYCDTPAARAPESGVEMTAGDILSRVGAAGIELVELTGGEPLAQDAARGLITTLLDHGYRVLVETGGGVSIAGVDPRAHVVLDVKTPGSGMHERRVAENFDLLKPSDEVKFVICSRTDYEWSRDFVRERRMSERWVVNFSPAEGREGISRADMASWILDDRLSVRLNLQLHIWIWGAGARGV